MIHAFYLPPSCTSPIVKGVIRNWFELLFYSNTHLEIIIFSIFRVKQSSEVSACMTCYITRLTKTLPKPQVSWLAHRIRSYATTTWPRKAIYIIPVLPDPCAWREAWLRDKSGTNNVWRCWGWPYGRWGLLDPSNLLLHLSRPCGGPRGGNGGVSKYLLLIIVSTTLTLNRVYTPPFLLLWTPFYSTIYLYYIVGESNEYIIFLRERV